MAFPQRRKGAEDGVEEVAVCRQQDCLLLLRQRKDGTISRSLFRQFEQLERTMACFLKKIRRRFREVFVEEKIHAAA
jgi:hypothetical protein